MLADRDHFRGGRDAADERSGTIAGGERQRGLDLGIAGKGFRAREVERAAVAVERIRALLRIAQATRYAVSVREKELRGVD